MSPNLPTCSSAAPLFFLHIPKTAGCSLREFLSQHYPPGQARWLSHDATPDAANPELLADLPLLGGHVCYAFVHKLLPRRRVLTFLRDPIDRAVSAYYYFRQFSQEGLAREKVIPALYRVHELSLAEFIEQEPQAAKLHLGNLQTWLLSQEWFTPTNAEMPRDLPRSALTAACENLANCDVIGLTERLPESLRLLCHTMGWPINEIIGRVNVTRSRPTREQLDAHTLGLLEDLTQLDRELVRFATSLFEERLRRLKEASHEGATYCIAS